MDNRFNALTSHLWRNGPYAYWWTPDNDTGKLSFWFPTASPRLIDQMLSRFNLYFSVHPSSINRGVHNRASLSDISAINCLFAEFDRAPGQTAEHLLASINQMDIPPSVIIHSGGGYHCYWLLDRTFVITTEQDREIAQGTQYAWVDHVGSDHAAKDLTRVLRVPGTHNHKPQYAPAYPLVEFVKYDLELLYTFEDLEREVQHIIDATNRRRAAATNATVVAVELDDQTIIEQMLKRDLQALALWEGDLSAYNDDHSSADQALCNKLAFWFGRDADRIDHVFRRSGLYRPKWLRDDYRQRTIDKAIASCKNTYTPPGSPAMGNPEQLVNGHSSPPPPAQGGTTSTPPPKKTKKALKSGNTATILNMLQSLGYSFRQNELDDTIDVNGSPIDDGTAAEIRCLMRDAGFSGMDALKDAYMMEAHHNRYHPIKDYLDALIWGGEDHIANLASHIICNEFIVYADSSKLTVAHAYLKRWLIGVVAKTYQHIQNFTLTLAGPQGKGKSTIPLWLCSPLANHYNEGQLDPDNKETDRRMAKTWIWEIGELGATTRRADVNALKNKLTQNRVTFRNPYGHHDVTKPVLTSFFGTVNPDGKGFLVDKTGNRRFAVVNMESIDFSYQEKIDPNQIWAQAMALYRAGVSWKLSPEEVAMQEIINAGHQVEETIDIIMPHLFYTDPRAVNLQMAPIDIGKELYAQSYAKDLDKCSKDAAAWLKNKGHVKMGRPPSWRGIRLRLPSDPW